MNQYVGEIRMFAGAQMPRGWVTCDGRVLPIASNRALYEVIGGRFGGDGKTTFALPDLRGRTPCCLGERNTIGSKGGAERVTIDIGTMPNHRHRLRGTIAAATLRPPSDRLFGATGGTTKPYGDGADRVALASEAVGKAGGGNGHANMQPFLTVAIGIAVTGLYPNSR